MGAMLPIVESVFSGELLNLRDLWRANNT